MLRSLIWINLKGMFFRSQQKRSKKRSALPAASFALLMVFVLCSLGFSFGSLFYGLMDSFKGMGLDWFYFAIAGILSFCMCFFFSIFATKSQLFEAARAISHPKKQDSACASMGSVINTSKKLIIPITVKLPMKLYTAKAGIMMMAE